MRIAFSNQTRFDCQTIEDIQLNLECRDEIIPLLAALQHLFGQPVLKQQILALVAADVNPNTRTDTGRGGFSYWQILVLAVMRLGCDLDYDKLQDLCENHRTLRAMMGIGDWDDATSFKWKRLRDTICLLKPITIKSINELIVAHGQQLHGNARQRVRADSFVVETNIHYPTESSLIGDGIRKMMPLCIELAALLDIEGWRQARHLSKRIHKVIREIGLISRSKSPASKGKLEGAYKELLRRADQLLTRANNLVKQAKSCNLPEADQLAKSLEHWIKLTMHVCDTAFRRVVLGETVPNCDKLFSLFEPHTQLHRRGKAGEPNQFGRLVLVFEDAAGFISHYHFMDRDAQDKDVIVEQTEMAQRLHGGEIQDASFDRGFYSEENRQRLEEIVERPCVPPRHPKQYADWLEQASVEFRQSRNRHAGVESAIGAIQSGNGMKRCRDKTEQGMKRYLGLAVLGRNLHVLGKILISRRKQDAKAAISKRTAA
jgi:hypothetical protein